MRAPPEPRHRRIALAALLALGVAPMQAASAQGIVPPPQVGPAPYAVPLTSGGPDQPYPPYTVLRYDEDYGYLADPSQRVEPSDRLKHVPIGGHGVSYLSFGASTRSRFDSYAGFPFDPAPRERGGYLLQRTFVHADAHLGAAVRVFGQLISAQAIGADPGPDVPFQEVDLDVNQLFADVRLGGMTRSLTLRAGRQELAYGAGRLIAPREGPNVRRPFDGLKAIGRSGDLRVDGFYMRPVQLEREAGVFDLGSNEREELFGLYATARGTTFGLLENEWFDLYTLRFADDRARFGDEPGEERRQTVGFRAYGSSPVWQYDLEAIGQFGRFAGQDIRAWALSALVGHLAFADGPLPVGLSLGLDAISGDGSPRDRRVGTFNALYPRAQYFTQAAFFGPANLLTVHPGLNLHPTPDLSVTLDALGFWRESRDDTLYTPGLVPQFETITGGRYIATQVGAGAALRVGRHLSLSGYAAHLFAGDGLKGAGGGDADYLTLIAELTF